MKKTKHFFLCLILFSTVAVTKQNLVSDVKINNDNAEIINNFDLIDEDTPQNSKLNTSHKLIFLKKTITSDDVYLRYQQYYKDILVYGRQVVRQIKKTDYYNKKTESKLFTGKVTKNLSLDIQPYFLSDTYKNEIINKVHTHYTSKDQREDITLKNFNIQPLIWITDSSKSSLVYQVSFQVQAETSAKSQPHYIINAQSKEIIEQWDNIQSITLEQGSGGNLKTGQYRYGTPGFPAMPVTPVNGYCYLSNSNVKVVSLNKKWELANSSNPVPIKFTCGDNQDNIVNGSWSAENDAFIFGNIVVEMYADWYKQSILSKSDGTNKQLILLVHAGLNYENAYWDGEYLIFGDGNTSYHPMVSLGITAHELAHAFTSSHSKLTYANQSGAINESFSDMSAIAAEYYLLQKYPASYQFIYKKTNLDWLIGDRIAKGNYALRSISQPHLFGSADCVTKGNNCNITWDDILKRSDQVPENDRQSYIVHKGSGIFNKAFYNIVNALNGDAQKAFELMVDANITRWTPSSNFAEAACSVKQVAKYKGIDVEKIHNAFTAVQVIPDC